MRKRIGIFFHIVCRAACLNLCFVLAVLGAASRTGSADVPELPLPNGAGNTPEMLVDLVPKGAAKTAGKMKLSSLRGRVVLLDMFRSNCPHCQEHAPHVVEFYNQYRQRGFTVLGLATEDKEDKAAVQGLKGFIAKARLPYSVGYITTELIAYYADSHNHGVPQMVLFGADGKMVLREIGWTEKIAKKFQQAIEEQLAKMPAPPAGGQPAPASARPRAKKG